MTSYPSTVIKQFMHTQQKTYAGIGSRQTPPDVLQIMTLCASKLESLGFILRSGGANGADAAFERGVQCFSMKQIFLPWAKFNSNESQLFEPPLKAYKVAEKYHPKFKQLSRSAKSLMARNVQQIYGAQLIDPVDFVICYTPDGCEHDSSRTRFTGGTGLAISIASLNGIPVFNLANQTSLDFIRHFVLSS